MVKKSKTAWIWVSKATKTFPSTTKSSMAIKPGSTSQQKPLTNMTTNLSSSGPSELAPGGPAALEVSDVYKRYGNVQALDGVSLQVREGTVHALVGENGSGKSTLMKVIAGIVTPDSGRVIIHGEELKDFTARTTLAHGVRVIYQDLALFPNMTVEENLGFAGDQPMLRSEERRVGKDGRDRVCGEQ